MVALRAISAEFTPDPNGAQGQYVQVVFPTCAVGDLLLAFHSGQSSIPAGWTVIDLSGGNSQQFTLGWRYATAADVGGSEPWYLSRDLSGVTIAAYSEPQVGYPFDVPLTGSGAWVAPSLTPLRSDDLLVLWYTSSFRTQSAPTISPSDVTTRRVPFANGYGMHHAIYERTNPGLTATGTYTVSGNWTSTAANAGALLLIGNLAPYAPTLLNPIGSQAFDRATVQRFTVQPLDPNTGDTISALGLRYRLSGGSTWTTVTQQSPVVYRDFAAGTFTAGTWEWQAQTTDAGGLSGPWSGSEFFVAADVPAAPVITAPVNNATLTAPTDGLVTWSVPQQEAWELRVVADNAGAPNTAIVYSGTGIVAETATRSAPVDRPVNGRVEHTQVRARYLGLWSLWGSVRNTVGYVAPALPNVSLAVTSRWVLVTLTSPAPTGGQPVTSYFDLWRRVVGSTNAVRIATLLSTGVYTDARIAHRVSYEYQAQSIGSNGSASVSGWTATATGNVAPPVTAGAYGSGAYGDGTYG